MLYGTSQCNNQPEAELAVFGTEETMREAFQHALLGSEGKEQGPIDIGVARLLQSQSAGKDQQRTVPPAVMEKAVYAARVLARRWSSTVGMSEPGRELERLRDQWIVLNAQLTLMPFGQRLQVLSEMAHEVQARFGLDERQHANHLADMLLHHSGRFAGVDDIAGLRPLSAGAFLVHAVEELADSPVEERRQLHAVLSEESSHREERPLWIIEGISAWLEAPADRAS
jgi:hypothetical protein